MKGLILTLAIVGAGLGIVIFAALIEKWFINKN